MPLGERYIGEGRGFSDEEKQRSAKPIQVFVFPMSAPVFLSPTLLPARTRRVWLRAYPSPRPHALLACSEARAARPAVAAGQRQVGGDALRQGAAG